MGPVAEVATIAAVTVVLFLVGSFLALRSTMRANEILLAMAALPSRWNWLFAMPSILTAVTVLMVIVAAVLWWSHQRSLAGRLYFTLLTLAALVAAADLVLIGR